MKKFWLSLGLTLFSFVWAEEDITALEPLHPSDKTTTMPIPTTPMVTIIITLRLKQTPYLNSSIISSRKLKGMNMNNSERVIAIAISSYGNSARMKNSGRVTGASMTVNTATKRESGSLLSNTRLRG